MFRLLSGGGLIPGASRLIFVEDASAEGTQQRGENNDFEFEVHWM